jgi:hypothetical protein
MQATAAINESGDGLSCLRFVSWLFVLGFEKVGEGFLVLGLGGYFVFDGWERMRGWWRAEALAGVCFDSFRRGEDLFPRLGPGHLYGPPA